ncbi:pyruvate dehydrogenase (acetyl-transferring) E1 component subunit alpha [Pseudactinotalea sp. Z1739]|uniref:pyruvate dehydrogenase (acetyl-transferring) E1 component subunit alpha n=1 Tax=Pseudactinotalea sp. Z1739 TaxID=3413028 RepID=UPI003C7A5A90
MVASSETSPAPVPHHTEDAFGGAGNLDASAHTVQLLTPTGERVSDHRYDPLVEHLDTDALAGLYRDMVLVRRFDAEATSLQRQGELGLWPPSLGQEAAQIGSGRAMNPRDYAFPSYREHGVAYTRGLDLTELLHLFRGQDHGGWDPARHNFHLYTLVIGSHTLHATGYAMAMQRDGDVGTGDPDRDRAAVAYFGDGATSQGDVYEAMVFAAVNDAPVVFFCQNNQWAISEPATRQSTVPLAQRATGVGIPSVRVDGNDVLACHAVTLEALRRARAGGGPTMIEAVTYRMGAHTTSDDPTRYRSRAEEDLWRSRDPIDRLRLLLEAEGIGSDFFTELDREAEELGERLRDYCRSLAPPPPSAMFEHVYATEHHLVTADREWFDTYQAGFEEGQ